MTMCGDDVCSYCNYDCEFMCLLNLQVFDKPCTNQETCEDKFEYEEYRRKCDFNEETDG